MVSNAFKSIVNHKNGRSAKVLYDVFPGHIADALLAGRKVEPKSHECVTIFFSDIVGFTTIASESEPLKVSNMLDRLYVAFDSLARKHDVFKVETIGDAFMGVTNLVTDQSDDHVKRIARFALEAVDAAAETLIDEDDPDKGFVQIRAVFHSGPVVSNVVGSLNPRYGLFGDCVNVSSRMESTSLAGKVQASESSALLLRDQDPNILLTKRGKVFVKGKGDMVTFWVADDVSKTVAAIPDQAGPSFTMMGARQGSGIIEFYVSKAA